MMFLQKHLKDLNDCLYLDFENISEIHQQNVTVSIIGVTEMKLYATKETDDAFSQQSNNKRKWIAFVDIQLTKNFEKPSSAKSATKQSQYRFDKFI